MRKRVAELLAASEQVIKDCAKPNGAIVAAPSNKPHYPKEAKDYLYVWPRDAMYTCKAASILGLDVTKKFLTWCMKAEGWSRTGLFYENYRINGKKARGHFQPDQTGSVLITAHDHVLRGGDPAEVEKLVRNSADGLCKVWSEDHFTTVTQDLWEERLCFPDIDKGFTYSLAICARGLTCAYDLYGEKEWQRVAEQMRQAIPRDKDHYYRSGGKLPDHRVDASLMGLLWPAGVVSAEDTRFRKTLQLIERRLAPDGGVHRYEHDEYDGWMYGKEHRKKGAGYWPVLNFWMAVCESEIGNRKKALSYYDKVLRDVNGRRLPEQVFDNDLQVPVKPLCWSHAMLVIATARLGLL